MQKELACFGSYSTNPAARSLFWDVYEEETCILWFPDAEELGMRASLEFLTD